MVTRILNDCDGDLLRPFALMAAGDISEAEAARSGLAINRWIGDWGDGDNDLGFIIEDQGQVRAITWMRSLNPSALILRGVQLPQLVLAVSPRYRGQGLGRQILERLLTEASVRRHRALCLTVEENNLIAQNLYHSLGFKTFGTPRGNHLVMAINLDRYGELEIPRMARLVRPERSSIG